MMKSVIAAAASLSLAATVNGAREGEWGINSPEPWLAGGHRAHKGYARNGKPLKVLVNNHMPGSAEKNMLESAKALSIEKSASGANLFDVTLLVC